MRESTKAHWVLLLVTILWGLTFPLIKDAVVSIDPTLFVMLRMLLAALVLLPFLCRRIFRISRYLLVAALLCGLLQAASYLCQSIGLETISSANSAFITALSVVLVPLLALVFGINRPHAMDFFAAIVCLVGIYVLTGASLSHINAGDWWTFANAVFYALFIVGLQIVAKKITDRGIFVFWLIALSLPLPLVMVFIQHPVMHLTGSAMMALIFCAVFATCLVFFLQTKYQHLTTVSKAAVIYTFEPIFATLFGYLINGEMVTRATLVGGGIVIVGFVLSQLPVWMRGDERLRRVSGEVH